MFDRLLVLPPFTEAIGAGDDPSCYSDASEAALKRLNAALAPAARQFAERRGGCMLCCGTATSGKEHFLDLGAHQLTRRARKSRNLLFSSNEHWSCLSAFVEGMRRSPPSTPGLAAAFLSELFSCLGVDSHTSTTEVDRATVSVGFLCSSNGNLTDVAALCGGSGRSGSQRVADEVYTSPGILQCMVPVTNYAEAIGLCREVCANRSLIYQQYQQPKFFVGEDIRCCCFAHKPWCPVDRQSQ